MSYDAIKKYTQVGLETGVASADPHKLILILFDGALSALAAARGNLERGSLAAKGEEISKAMAAIAGLKASLDLEKGGEIAENLAALYEYMLQKLLFANLNHEPKFLEEVGRLLTELKGAWAAIGPQNSADPGAAGRV